MSVAALVIRPASDTSTVGFGSPRFVWLKALKFSHRNSRVFPSRMTKFLDRERLNRCCGGPRSEPLEAADVVVVREVVPAFGVGHGFRPGVSQQEIQPVGGPLLKFCLQ